MAATWMRADTVGRLQDRGRGVGLTKETLHLLAVGTLTLKAKRNRWESHAVAVHRFDRHQKHARVGTCNGE